MLIEIFEKFELGKVLKIDVFKTHFAPCKTRQKSCDPPTARAQSCALPYFLDKMVKAIDFFRGSHHGNEGTYIGYDAY